MAISRITADRDAVVSEIDIAAPPERVFQALINREQALQWGTNEAFQMTFWEMDARPGGRWRFTSKERSGKTPAALTGYDHHGEVLEIDPPRLLAYSWFANWHENPLHRTLVRWETGTHLKVTHSGLTQLPEACQGYSQGWPGLVQSLKNSVENYSGASS
jgi:uncharacterized protein YndB with AHSA1/START domain